jgi:hypothetical protein
MIRSISFTSEVKVELLFLKLDVSNGGMDDTLIFFLESILAIYSDASYAVLFKFFVIIATPSIFLIINQTI